MDHKIVFFDIDDTLVDSRAHMVPDSAMEALQRLRKKEYILCVATGRSIHSLHNAGFDDQLFHWDAYVCNNGQALYDQNKQLISAVYIAEEAVLSCIKTAEELGSPLLMEGNTTILSDKPNEFVYTAHHYFDEPIPEVRKYQNEDILMMCAYAPLGFDYAPYQKIEGIDVMPGQSTFADIVAQGCTKYSGICKMLEIFHKDGYIAFGDSLNDLEMLEHAHLSIAMGQGNERVKEAADHVTAPVYEDGILTACKKLGLI